MHSKYLDMKQNNCNWVRLGDYIEMRHENNSSLKYGVELIEGVNNNGEFQQTKALTQDINLKPYKVVRHGDIVYNPSRLNIGSLAYRVGEMCIVSHLYQVFHVKEEYKEVLSSEFLTLYLRRNEFHRYVDYDNFGSQRAEYNLKKLGELRIPLPSIENQQKAVNAWKALREIKEQNESLAAPLLQVCQSYIQELKHKYESTEIGPYITIKETRNTNNDFMPVLGININKDFMPTAANMEGISLSNYKVMEKGMFVFSGMQTGRDVCIRTGMYKGEGKILVSPAYTTYVVDESIILPGYLDLYFKRKEMDRLGAFYSDSSVRANLDWPRFMQIRIPIPPLSTQKAIVNLYNCAIEAKAIAEEADRKSREICPALIQHVIHN